MSCAPIFPAPAAFNNPTNQFCRVFAARQEVMLLAGADMQR